MTKFQTKITTAFATGAVLLNAIAPLAFAETTLTISGNGAGSTNGVSVTDTSSQTVSQTNTANVTNTVTNNVNTGHNAANFNTGDGSVTVKTGDATVKSTVDNVLNSNQAELACCKGAQDTKVTVDGNGAFSNNGVALNQGSTTSVAQTNAAAVTNNVTNNVDTGYNQAGFNTGDGVVAVVGGNVDVTTNVSTSANANVARIGSAGAAPVAGGTQLYITDNGAGSKNSIGVTMPNTTSIAQTNSAAVTNTVANNANSGHNAANFNTGDGMVVIDPGNIKATTTVDNWLNFNAADLDCGCVLNGGLKAVIDGNGAAPEGYNGNAYNTIGAVLGSVESLGQVNGVALTNYTPGNYDTGWNEASKNTSGGAAADPAVLGGDVVVTNHVSNEGNSNVMGNFTLPWTLPHLQTSFDLSGMFHVLGMWWM